MAQIRVASQFHSLLDSEPLWHSEVVSFSQLIHDLSVRHPRFHASVVDPLGRLRNFVALAIDDVVYVDFLDDELPDLRRSQEIEIFSAVAGG